MSAAVIMRRLAALGGVLWAMLPAVALAQASPSNFTTATRYDNANRVVGTIAPDPDGSGPSAPLLYAAVRNTYDNEGRLISVEKGQLSSWQNENTLPSAWPVWNPTTATGFQIFTKVVASYDGLGRKVLETTLGSSDGGATWVQSSATQYSYDPVGRPECTAVRMNPTTWGALPASACTLATTSSTDGPDRIAKNVYDDAGQLLKVIKAYGQTTANGLPQLQQDYVTYTYTDNGKQKTLKDANGNLTTYSYDGFDRLVAWAFPSKTATGSSAPCTIGTIAEATDGFGNTVTSPSETRTAGDDCEKYAYDRNGNRAKLMKRDGNVIRYAFDALNRNTIKDIPGGTLSDVYFGYDARGLQTFARFVSTSGAGITNVYDGFGQLASTTNNMDFAPLALGYQYDADGNRIRITHPDGTYFTYDYDGLDRATTIKVNGAATIATIGYDNQGRRSGDTRSGVSTSYGYDSMSRLANLSNDLAGTTNDVTSAFGYNPASQIVTKTRSNDAYAFTGYVNVPGRSYTVNGLNQYTAAGSASFTYDDNGNLTGDGTNTYTYDVENRMVRATTTAGTNTIIYDPLGRLWQISRGDGTSWFDYLHDGDNIVAKYGVSATASFLNSRFVFGPGEDEPLIWYLQSDLSSPRSFQSDAQGSIVSVADVSGNMQNIIAYDEYGISSYADPNSKPLFGYTGQVWLPMIGLNYYKARMYSPTLGRFMQTDPIGYKDQNNLYAYVGNDPIDGRDPTGLDTVVSLQSYMLGTAPIQGEYGHQYVLLRDTETGETVISRAGPSAPYPAPENVTGVSGVISGASAKDPNSQRTITLVTEMKQAGRSTDSNPDTGRPLGKTVSGSTVTIKGSIGEAEGKLDKFNKAIDAAGIPYRPLSTNSNAYAGTAYGLLTGKDAPTSGKLPGSGTDLQKIIAPPPPDSCKAMRAAGC